MTRRSVCTLILGACLAVPAAAQVDTIAPSAVVEPEDISVIHFLDGNNLPVPLEMRRAQLVSRDRIFRGAQQVLVVPGVTSPVQFTEGALPTFVVQVLLPMQLPTEYELFPITVRTKENQRAALLFDQGWGNSRGSQGIHLRVRRYGKNSFKIIPSSPLPPGEYAFKFGLYASQSKDLYCFTVLPKQRPSSEERVQVK